MFLSIFSRSTRAVCQVAALVFCFAAFVGCGNGRSTVAGKVTFDGEPVADGRIALEPVDGQGMTAGGKITAGEYRLAGDAGVPAGNYKVSITATRHTGRQVEAGPPSPPGTMVDEIEHFIPSKYNRETTLTCEVMPGTNQHDFALASAAAPSDK